MGLEKKFWTWQPLNCIRVAIPPSGLRTTSQARRRTYENLVTIPHGGLRTSHENRVLGVRGLVAIPRGGLRTFSNSSWLKEGVINHHPTRWAWNPFKLGTGSRGVRKVTIPPSGLRTQPPNLIGGKCSKVAIPHGGLRTKEGEISYETLEESPSHAVGLERKLLKGV